ARGGHRRVPRHRARPHRPAAARRDGDVRVRGCRRAARRVTRDTRADGAPPASGAQAPASGADASASGTAAAAGDERRAALTGRAGRNAPAALVAQLASAVRFLTIVPITGGHAAVGESALFFPLVGLALGALLVVVDRVMAPVAPLGARDVILVAI